MTEERVILVDEKDREIGTKEKLATHRDGDLHRAFSILVFDDHGQLLLQRRAASKYHSALLWSNTCCGHPRPGESLEHAAHRRLVEEMGFDCDLSVEASFIYRAELENGLIENELDHVLVGRFIGIPDPCPQEVEAWRWTKLADLSDDMRQRPKLYTAWFGSTLQELERKGSLSRVVS
jgi:isopentenyl-diphosphate delta-isomerase